MMEKPIKQYKDIEGVSVKVGDTIEQLNYPRKYFMGKVLSMRKEGFYVWVKTERNPNREIWGKFTKKVFE